MLACVAIGTTAAPERPWPVDYEAEEGFYVGKGFTLSPQLEGLIGYDDRVKYSPADGKTGDAYSDVAVAAELVNAPSVYNLFARGRYGYRMYATDTELNDDFYTVAGGIGTEKDPFIWDVRADLTKSLDTDVNYFGGSSPDPVLTYLANTRLKADAKAEYDKRWFGKTSIVPGYAFNYFNQEYDVIDYRTEWVIQQASLLVRRQHTKKTRFAAGMTYSLQSRDIEDGRIGTLLVGMEHRMTDKTSWAAELGYAIANYDLSGEDQGVVSRLSGNWRFTDKLSFYVFGGNQFLPGYGSGPARWVYRLGYGGRWQYAPKLNLRAAVLHDYQQAIGDQNANSSIYGTVRNYIDLKAGYEPTDPLELAAGIRYNDDERPEPQTKIYLQAIYKFY